MNYDEIKIKGEGIRNSLMEEGIYEEITYESPQVEDGRVTTTTAYPIKAFEKFLGFYNNTEKIAFNPSISFNTDFSFCISSCRYVKEDGKDFVSLDGEISTIYNTKAGNALNYFRKRFNLHGSFQFNIQRFRRYENAKGMSESSAVAAAVALSLVENVFPNMKNKDSIASRFARLVSGSGTRACINGLSIWLSYPGIDPDQSFAVKLKNNPMKFHYGIFPNPQNIATDKAHETAIKSVFYESWIRDKYDALSEALKSDFDYEYLLKRGQKDSLNLHSVLLSGGLIIQTPESISLLRKILDFQKKNEGLYLNADTGPSIMIGAMDKSLLHEFAEFSGNNYLEGSYEFRKHLNHEEQFRKKSEEFFNNNIK